MMVKTQTNNKIIWECKKCGRQEEEEIEVVVEGE